MRQAVFGENEIKVWAAPVIENIAFFQDREMVAGACGDFKSLERLSVNQSLELFVIHRVRVGWPLTKKFRGVAGKTFRIVNVALRSPTRLRYTPLLQRKRRRLGRPYRF
jgi:hypothetical protein